MVEEAGFTVSKATHKLLCKFTLSIPFFETLDEVREELASWIPLFELRLDTGKWYGVWNASAEQII